MESSEPVSCKNCKHREKMQDEGCKSCKIKCSAIKSRQCGHCSNKYDRRDENKPEKHIPDMGYRDCRAKERINYLTIYGNDNECRQRTHNERCKSCKIKCSAIKSGQYGHCSSNYDGSDEDKSEEQRPDFGYGDCSDKERTNYLTVDGNGSECGEEERRNDHDRLGCKGHKTDKRNEYWRESMSDSYARGKSMSREKCSDSHNFTKFRRTTCRHSGSRSKSRAISRSSSEESSCGIFDGLWMKCNSTINCDSSTSIDDAEKQRQTLHSACRSHNFLERNGYVTEHGYCQCCHRNISCCCNTHSCHSRKRKHKHYSSESDEATTKVGRTSDCCQQEHGHGCHGQIPSSHYDVHWVTPCKDALFCPDRMISPKCKKFIPERRCVWSALGSPYHVQSQDFYDTGLVKTISKHKEGSSGTHRGKNKLWSSCAGAKADFDAGKNEDQEDQYQWLDLSLKTPQKSELNVEGASKNDLKLSFPDSISELNMEGPVPSGLPNIGLHSSTESIKYVGGNELPLESSNICFSVWSRNVNPFSLPQTLEESIVKEPAVLSNLNLSESIVSIDADTIPPIIDGKSVSGLDQNYHYSHTTTRDPECTVLDESNLDPSGISEDKHHTISDHAVLAKQRNGLPPTLSISLHKEERRVLCLSESQLEATSTADAADCGIGNECNASDLLQSERTKEFFGSVIIIDDSEDECSEQGSLHGFHKKKKLVGSSCNISVLKEISHGDREDPLHASKDSYIQGISLARNILPSGMEVFDLEYRSASLENAQRKAEVENGVNLRGIYFSESYKNIGECAGSAEELAEDNCRAIEVISSEDEFVDNNAYNVTLPYKYGTLQESGFPTLGDCVTSRDTDHMILSDSVTFSHKENDNSDVGDSSDKISLSDLRLHKKLEFCPKVENRINEAVCSSRGISSTLDPKHLDLQYVEALIQIANSKPRMWDTGILCDLCGRGPSLIYGEWYAWCCGYRLCYCKCTEDHQRKLKLSLNPKNKKPSKRWVGHQWSGKVHRLCGLWSSEVFEKDDGKDKLEGLLDAVKRGKKLDCKDPECRRFGATLGCRVKNCRRSFHYPCAVKLASQLRCRIWEGCRRPVACYLHRHVDHDCVSAKEWQSNGSHGNKLMNPGKGNMNTAIYPETRRPHQNIPDNIVIIQDFNSNNVDQEKTEENERRKAIGRKDKIVSQIYGGNRFERDGLTLSRIDLDANNLQFLGQNLICEDLSCGKEAVKIPCTNDIDDASVPYLEYITSSKFSANADAIWKTVLENVKKQAKPCSGCYKIDVDDPKASISVHVNVNEGARDQDRRIDWQGEPMLGRLPYDHYGLLQLGWLTIDVVECNSRCWCGSKCVNRELQKGLQLALEVFKTRDRGWGVRTLQQIPRGKFVMEYVGEVLTQVEASKRGQLYAEYNSSYLCNLDHPAVAQENHLVLDGFKMSNVARFINHSCEGNLRIYRVYTETLDHRIFRIGLYACRDIEIGEELTYDYKFIQEEPPVVSADESSAVKCFCRAKNCRQVLLSGDI